METPSTVLELVERFDAHRDAYKSPEYNETQVRREFIDPFFEAMGWDVNNRRGFAEPYKDVVHEDMVRIGGVAKAPDYSFRLGGRRMFFLEAKKPAVNLRDDASPAFQLRRYAWTAKLPVSILTDFEEFIVYDTRVKPAQEDKASTARVFYIPYTDYPTRWGDIASLFSPQAIQKGALDKFVESSTRKRGTAEVDDAFLAEIEEWRDLLARNIALRNQSIAQRDLNFAVQTTIDRIVFLRICEDRAIEPYGQLQALLNGGDTYARLRVHYDRADERYNSGLFHFHKERDRAGLPDTLTPRLVIDDKVLKAIIKRLYYPESPYEFSVLPAEILGQVYERFLGSVIRLTAGGQAKVEQKPEVRKAGGVYYTPSYIVDYIVKHTVGKLLEGKTPQDIAGVTEAWRPSKTGHPLAILDPACGSGSFLLGAYQYLLDWHLDCYTKDTAKWSTGKNPRIYQDHRAVWRLVTAERKRILLANIYGVDIDPQAVEVTKLSLLLRVLEGENADTLSKQFTLFHERALPDLANNIKCGNSLIGPDFYQGRQTDFDEEESYRINAFDWTTEFPQIMQSGGFDAIIGNPPYIRIQTLKEWAPLEVEVYKDQYVAASKGNYDIYVVFVERGMSLLNATGRLGFILPHKFFNAQYGQPLRELLARGQHLGHVVHFGDQQVFSGATTYTCLLFLDNTPSDHCDIVKVDDLDAWRATGHATEGVFPHTNIGASEWNFTVGSGAGLFERLASMPVKLGDIAKMFVGLQTSADTVFLFKETTTFVGSLAEVYSKALERNVTVESALLKPVVRSGSIGRYHALATAHVLFPYRLQSGRATLVSPADMEEEYPKAWEYLLQNKAMLCARESGKFRASGWYQLYPKNLELWEQPKIMIPYMVTELSAFYDDNNLYFVNVTTGGFGITLQHSSQTMQYITGLLNSRLLNGFMKQVSTTFHGGYFAANKQFLVQIPVRSIDFSDQGDKARHDKMVSLVQRMLDLHKRLQTANTEHERAVLQRQITATDDEIDRLVYELYELTDEEVAIVEGADKERKEQP